MFTVVSQATKGHRTLISPKRVALFILILLLLATGLLFAQAYQSVTRAHDYHRAAVRHAVVSAARELALYVAGKQRTLALFADEQRELLVQTIAQPRNTAAQSRLAARMRRHFPEHLAYAVADPLAISVYASESGLFGQHCRRSVEAFASDPPEPLPTPTIHVSIAPDTEHFDVLSRVPDAHNADQPAAILFASFRTEEIRRFLGNFVVTGRQLLLIEMVDEQEARQVLLTGNGSGTEVEAQQKVADQAGAYVHEVPVAGTSWLLRGRLSPQAIQASSRSVVLQATIGFTALLFASAVMWWAVRADRRNTSQARVVLEGVERERKRIARDLHDQVLADVSHVRRLIAALGERFPESGQVRTDFSSVEKNLYQLTSGVRAAIDDLHPHMLDNLGLAAAVQDCVDKRCGDQMTDRPLGKVEVHGDPDGFLSDAQKLHLYRIVIELLNNALCHSRCDVVRVELAMHEDRFELRVSDDGVGFDPRSAGGAASRGLANVLARTRALDAKARWLQTPDQKGSRFELRLSTNRLAEQHNGA